MTAPSRKTTQLARLCAELNAAGAQYLIVGAAAMQIPTCSIDDLIESKRTGRLQNAADIEILEEIRRLRRMR